jgi:aryl-alcohol dehydrogenase-like predicted oxidoreductase
LDKPVISDTRFLYANQLGLGAWAWGDRLIWQYGRAYNEKDLRQAFQTSISEGIRFFDTAEVYGGGRSERFLGQFIKEFDEPVLVATKFSPLPWRLTRNSIPSALRESLKRLGLEKVDLYQIHWPSPLLSVDRMMEGLRICVEEGLTRSAGVSNFDQSYMLRAYSTLARYNIPLAANQVHYSLLHRGVERNGLLTRCKELGVRLIAYSPLEMGLLTGKYGPDNPPPGSRALRYSYTLAKIPPVLKVLTEIGQDHGGKSNAQVALNWVICKGALPIPGVKNPEQVLQNAGALGWQLTTEEVSRLDEASDAALK